MFMIKVRLLSVIPLLTLACHFNLHAQEPAKKIVVRGLVRDSISHGGVPFASISIVGTTLGTATDEKGNFYLSISPLNLTRGLRISSIGYRTKAVRIISEKDSVVFDLQPASRELDEVSVSGDSINSKEVIKTAINNIPANYIQTPFNCEFFSDIKVTNVLTLESVEIQSIIFGYYPGYVPSGKRKFQIKEARTTGKDPFDGYYIPTHEIHVNDVISNPDQFGIFNKDNLDKINFRYEGSTLFENDTVFSISYNIPNPTKKLTGFGIKPKYFKGHVTVAVRNYAIVEHSIETERMSGAIRYRQIDDYYFPYSILGRRNMYQNLFTLENRLHLLKVNTDNVTKPDDESNEVDFSKVKYNMTFWESHYPKSNERK
jgi:hypothetical protein